jgi:hypothetical protein
MLAPFLRRLLYLLGLLCLPFPRLLLCLVRHGLLDGGPHSLLQASAVPPRRPRAADAMVLDKVLGLGAGLHLLQLGVLDRIRGEGPQRTPEKSESGSRVPCRVDDERSQPARDAGAGELGRREQHRVAHQPGQVALRRRRVKRGGRDGEERAARAERGRDGGGRRGRARLGRMYGGQSGEGEEESDEAG